MKIFLEYCSIHHILSLWMSLKIECGIKGFNSSWSTLYATQFLSPNYTKGSYFENVTAYHHLNMFIYV